MASQSPIHNAIQAPAGCFASVEQGWSALAKLVLEAGANGGADDGRAGGKAALVGIDGYLGVDWDLLVREVGARLGRAGAQVRWLDTRAAMLPRAAAERAVSRYLPKGEPVFGRVCREELRFLFDRARLQRLGRKLQAFAGRPGGGRQLLICFGPGALLTQLAGRCRLGVWVDLTREEALKRNQAWIRRKSRTQSVSPRRIYYVEFPLYDRHRRRALPHAQWYVDGNQPGNPKLLSTRDLSTLTAAMCRQPLRFKPLYEPGVWGGQWLKTNRGLPAGLRNCAYGFEIIAPEQSLLVAARGVAFELPFNLFSTLAGGGLMGQQARRRFGGLFPIRVSYDDTWGGGNLSIQVHPTAAYMRQLFREPMHQAEMYYIFEARPGSIVHLGLREGADPREFRRQAAASEAERRPFDHTRFVNVVPARKGDILLIPPGTIHGAGAGEVVLEISSTPYRYTFKIYDYCRADLDGSYRPLHLAHAFKVLKGFRTSRWVAANLLPRPRLLRTRSGADGGWREYVIADRREFHHVVHRIEFSRLYRDDTDGRFHLLNLVGGRMVSVRSRHDPKRVHRLAFSETLLIPRGVGEYEVIGEAGGPFQVVKTFLRNQ